MGLFVPPKVDYTPLSEHLFLLECGPIPAEFRRAYSLPGMVVKAHFSDTKYTRAGFHESAPDIGRGPTKIAVEKYLALASPPDSCRWTFLVRDRRHRLAEIQPHFALSPPAMGGFTRLPKTGDVHIYVTGTALSPARALLEARPARENLSGVTLFYGVRNGSEVAFEKDLVGYAKRGARIVVCYSDGSAKVNGRRLEGCQVHRGHITAFLSERAVESKHVYTAGQPELMSLVEDHATYAYSVSCNR